MHKLTREHASAISAVQRGLADMAVDLHFESDPTMDERYGPGGRRIWRTEALARLGHLAASVACDRPAYFTGHIVWAAAALRARGVSEADIQGHVLTLAQCLAAELPTPVAAHLVPFFHAATSALAEPPDHEHGLIERTGEDSTLARLFLLHLLQRDHVAASTLALEALHSGSSLLAVYERIVSPALSEIGRMWHIQEASIADEHFGSAAVRAIIVQLRAATKARPADGRRALCCTVDGDLHDSGVRMFADLLEVEGWTVEFLGADVPATEVVMSIADVASDPNRAFDLVAVGASTMLSVRAAMDLADAMQASPEARRVPLLIGGGAFTANDGLAESIGATAAAGNLSEAVAVAGRLVPARGASTPR
ncbi:MAG: cobalamin-dependent protein [Planctomycetota bacterium]